MFGESNIGEDKMWRPEGWDEKKFPIYSVGKEEIGDSIRCAYELGADAMLKAVRGRGFISGESIRHLGPGVSSTNPKSKWYSIPDDE